MSEILSIVVATSNEGKLSELRRLLGDVPVQLLSAASVLGEAFSVNEDGVTFESNAVKKAKAACAATGLYALADESGLEVEALGGRPGVRSARFAHERATDAENNAALLRELAEVGDDGRHASFHCVLALRAVGSESRRGRGRRSRVDRSAPRGSAALVRTDVHRPELGTAPWRSSPKDEKTPSGHRARAAAFMRSSGDELGIG